MAICCQLTSLPFKGLIKTINNCNTWNDVRCSSTTCQWYLQLENYMYRQLLIDCVLLCWHNRCCDRCRCNHRRTHCSRNCCCHRMSTVCAIIIPTISVILVVYRLPHVHRVSKTVQNCFCQNFVKFPPILISFGRKMAKRLKLCEVHSFSTSSNLRHYTNVLNANVPNCYTTLKVVICNKLSND